MNAPRYVSNSIPHTVFKLKTMNVGTKRFYKRFHNHLSHTNPLNEKFDQSYNTWQSSVTHETNVMSLSISRINE